MKIKYYLLLLLATSYLISCEKELDHPPKKEINYDAVMTIKEIRDLYQNEAITINGDANFFAVITMDESTGNLYRGLYVQDSTAAINLRLTSPSYFSVGDSVRVSLDGAILDSYAEMLQLDNIDPSKNIVKQASGKNLEPQVVSIPNISGDMQGKLVKLENVQFFFGDTLKPYADAANQESLNRILEDSLGNKIIVRTSGFADFANQLTPSGSGCFTGIVTQFRSFMQLLIRDTDEIVLENERYVTTAPSGQGTYNDPYNVIKAYAFNEGNNVWVKGFIVGVMETSVDPFQPRFAPPFNTALNIIISDRSNENSLLNSLIVQLPFGDVRNALNLVNNPENLGKQVIIRGNLGLYFGQPGIRDASDFTLIDPTFWEERFSSNINTFSTVSITGAQKWAWNTWNNGSAQIKGAVGDTYYENEDWLISPEINLAGKDNVHLEIRETINFLTDYDDLQVLISENYDGTNPNQITWTRLEEFNRPPGNDWTAVVSGHINISGFDGKKIHIAFKYTSDTEGASDWRVSSVRLMEL